MFRPRLVCRLLSALLFVSIFMPGHLTGSTGVKDATVTPLTLRASESLLPGNFAGWQLAGTPQQSTDPRVAGNTDASVLQEYGFSRYEEARYTREQDTLSVKATEFGDATGAYGAFTFYRRPNMASEPIGQDGAFDGTRVLFWSGTVLVDAKFSRLTAMSAAELRDLARQLPKPTGNLGILPSLPAYLPPRHLMPMTVDYAVGPLAYQKSGGVLPPALVDFGRSAETVTAQYNSLNGTGTLTIIDYPTPEIATERLRALKTFLASRGAGNTWTAALASSNPEALEVRRSGPLVAVTSGSFSSGTAAQLLQQVHYEVNLTMSNSSKYVPDTAKIAQIILNVGILVGIFAVVAIVSAVSLGGGRALMRKMRNKSGSADYDSAEFIRLNLDE